MEQPTKLERGKLGTFALILPLQSLIDQDRRLSAFSVGAGHSTDHLAHYLSVDKRGRAAFPGQECQKGNVCFSF